MGTFNIKGAEHTWQVARFWIDGRTRLGPHSRVHGGNIGNVANGMLLMQLLISVITNEISALNSLLTS